jgi:hypothetical protein
MNDHQSRMRAQQQMQNLQDLQNRTRRQSPDLYYLGIRPYRYDEYGNRAGHSTGWWLLQGIGAIVALCLLLVGLLGH